ncbi:MAG: hypothetical protein IT385_23635, partial [Deltaproteobacteria bacterium]|nr:hypothetical protein [Deltaproteobacteria bacterium]
DSGWSTCSARTPAAETCNGVDDDCDSAVDDVPGRGEACIISNDHGACDGVRDCGAGPGLVCVGQTPAPETCNYVDDDCDSATDEDFGTLFASCSAGRGVCVRYGFEVCNAAGDDTECNAVAGPEGVESCNGLDDDCDGLTDELFPGKGDVCQAGLGVCARFGTKVCNGGGTALECSASEGPSSDEACDLLDNDCDGQTDETFKTGDRYTAVTACGNCFTNCQAIYARPNAFGVCNTVPATPVCQMQCNGGSYDLNAVPDDGCEFQLDTTAIYVSQSDAAAKDDGGCGGGPSATGGGRYPCKTITFGMGRATSSTPQRGKVLVASGAYNESITLQSGLSLYGGYDALTWNPVRAPKVHITAIFGSGGAGHRKTVIAQGIKSSVTVFDGFTVYGQVAGAVANGEAANSYGIYVRDSNQSLEIRNNIVWGGTGGPGKSGSRGTNGAAGGHGRAGVAAYEPAGDFACYGSTCEAQASAGGAGGTNSVCASGTAGGAGGTAHCPDFDETRDLCSDTTPMTVQTNTAGGFAGSGDNAGAGGTGGCDSMIDPFLEDGDPTLQGCVCRLPDDSGGECPLGQRSAAGDNGAPGQPGTGGGRASSGSGEVASAEWRGLTAGSGGNGTVGSGGGGGGAGGGVETYAQPTYYCVGSEYTDIGGSGGGGGAGGCGGAGGGPGSPGGGSFAIFVVFDQSPGTALPTITQNEVHTGFGGVGGRGGDGGTAGAGGNGGGGGAGGPPGSTFWCADSGSKGGEGGAGGPGGGGGGGVGGASFGMFVSGQGSANLSAWSSNNTVLVDGAGGQGGAGGGAGPGGNAGLDGLVGSSQARNF